MALIHSPRFRPGDLEAWERRSRLDKAFATTRRHRRLVEDAELRLVRWTRSRKGYVGVSWGKDSVVVAEMAVRLIDSIDWPLVWVRVEGVENPDCPAVRDAFLARFPSASARYEEIRASKGRRLTSERGFAEAKRRYGRCHVSGVRGDESNDRQRMRAMSGGENRYALAPLIDWTASDVFSRLASEDLPVHPAYACSAGGVWDRDRLRVGAVGGERGGTGRFQWEALYYPDRPSSRTRGKEWDR